MIYECWVDEARFKLVIREGLGKAKETGSGRKEKMTGASDAVGCLSPSVT